MRTKNKINNMLVKGKVCLTKKVYGYCLVLRV